MSRFRTVLLLASVNAVLFSIGVSLLTGQVPAAPKSVISSSTYSTGTPVDSSYFDSLVARADKVASYSLRDQAQLDAIKSGHSLPAAINYVWPNDPYPDKQDAGKVVIDGSNLPPGTTGGNSLQNQIRVPVPASLMTGPWTVTWDAWWGHEFLKSNTGLTNQKCFQLASNGAIYTEIRTRFDKAGNAPNLAGTDIRWYGTTTNLGPGAAMGGTVGSVSYGSDSLAPMQAEFITTEKTWTRYWLSARPSDDNQWWLLSLWVADANRDAVQVYRDVPVRAKLPTVDNPKGSWNQFWFEYNTSTDLVLGVRPLVGYVRNLVMVASVNVEHSRP